MVRARRNAKEILIPKISVTRLGDYTHNVGYKTGSITYEYETHGFGYDRAVRLFADVTMNAWEYRVKWYGEDEKTAKARARELGRKGTAAEA